MVINHSTKVLEKSTMCRSPKLHINTRNYMLHKQVHFRNNKDILSQMSFYLESVNFVLNTLGYERRELRNIIKPILMKTLPPPQTPTKQSTCHTPPTHPLKFLKYFTEQDKTKIILFIRGSIKVQV